MSRCIAVTKSGSRCKNSARSGSEYCHLHQPLHTTVRVEEEAANSTFTEESSSNDQKSSHGLMHELNQSNPLTGILGFLGFITGVVSGFIVTKGEAVGDFFIYAIAISVMGIVAGFTLDVILRSIFGTEKYTHFFEAAGLLVKSALLLVFLGIGAFVGYAIGDHWYTSIPLAILGMVIAAVSLLVS